MQFERKNFLQAKETPLSELTCEVSVDGQAQKDPYNIFLFFQGTQMFKSCNN